MTGIIGVTHYDSSEEELLLRTYELIVREST